MERTDFQNSILQGIPAELPPKKEYDLNVSHAPLRKEILNDKEKKLALKNALRYFEPKHHAELAPEFTEELENYGRIYMYRFRPTYEMKARPIHEYPAKSQQAAAIMLMIQNNLDPAVAQHPYELITYGGNGAVFQNWAQYLLTMKYLSQMSEEQTLHMYSGHPMGLFPSSKSAPRVVVTAAHCVPSGNATGLPDSPLGGHVVESGWNEVSDAGFSQVSLTIEKCSRHTPRRRHNFAVSSLASR